MKKIFLLVIVFTVCETTFSQPFPASLAGRWTFDNLSNPLQATVGTNLILNGTHTAVTGIGPLDGAYNIGVGSYYTCTHGIPANGGGTTVNEYSIMFDFKVPDVTNYHCFYQTNMSNSNDGEVFVGTMGQIGISATGYSGLAVPQNTWHRLVVAVDLGTSFKYYLDGHLILNGTSQAVDGRFSLDIPNVLFFADENGEDYPIIVSQIAIFSACLTDAEVLEMGGLAQSNIRPYLQTPTPNSMYVSWNSYDVSTTIVQYGTTTSLTETATGTYENISGNMWHTVKMTGLQPGIRYYYRCISGDDTSETYPFRTPALPGTPGSHVRFAIVSDSQSDVTQSNKVADSLLSTLINNYGTYWYDSLSLVFHTGDITQLGSYAARFSNEYFNTFYRISCSVPFMISIGNHEMESSYYYNFMKYEDLSDFPLPNTLNEKYYSFFLGNCQFIALNTSGSYNDATQTSWLHEKLVQSDTNDLCDFVFVMNHQPAHSEMWPDGNTSYVETDVTGELVQFPKVTLNSHGHSHNYERGIIQSTHPGRWDFRISIIGGAGGALDRWGMYANQTDYPEVQRTLDYYCYGIVEVNKDNRTCDAKMYSLGNPDKPMNNEVMDTWHRYPDQPAPDKPVALSPVVSSVVNPELTASPFSGVDSIMSSRFQLVKLSGNWSNPVIDILRDGENTYGVTAAPNYDPININAGIDLKRYSVPVGNLTIDSTYKWRVCYRDHNARWSEWSDSSVFTVVSSLIDQADFIANVTTGNAPLVVQFTDLSYSGQNGWEWDFENNGTSDSYLRDPVFTYTTPGVYTVSLTSQFGSLFDTETKPSYITVLDPMGIENTGTDEVLKVSPNPFNNKVVIDFTLRKPENISLQILRLDGTIVTTLADGIFAAGDHTVCWDGSLKVHGLPSEGVYICKLMTKNNVSIIKLIHINEN